jgi:hypothetical protein
MAETTDRFQSAPSSRGNQVDVIAGDEQVYRPLSLLALAGFGISVISAALIATGGLIAVFTHYPRMFLLLVVLTPLVAALVSLFLGIFDRLRILKIAGIAFVGLLSVLGLGGLLVYSGSAPWLLPMWSLALPLAGLLICWIARGRILASEGTLSGLGLCNVGMSTVAVFGLLYVAYYAATWVAVRQQSAAFATEWMARLQKGETDRAFVLTIPPDKRPPDDGSLRTALENYWNLPGPQSPSGAYTEFCLKDHVRFLGSTGDVKVEPLGLVDWRYEEGKYQARYDYRVTSSMGSIDVEVTVVGQEPPQGEAKGRQWAVDPAHSGRKGPPDFTTAGKIMVDQTAAASNFITTWFEKWYREDDEAYLLTLPISARSGAQAQRLTIGAAAGEAATWDDPGRAAFYAGSLVVADPKVFYAPRTYRDTVPALLRQCFAPGSDKPYKALINSSSKFPFVQINASGGRISYDAIFVFKDLGEGRDVLVDALVVLECGAESLSQKEPDWQLKEIQLLRAHSPNSVPGGPPGLRATAPRPPG